MTNNFMEKLAKSEDYKLISKVQTSTSETEKKTAMLKLWNKYLPLIQKMNNKLLTTAKENHWSRTYEFDDYVSGTYERLKMAIENIEWSRLCNLVHPEKWSLYVHFWGYLSAYNRDLRNDFLKRVCGTTKDKKTANSKKKVFQEVPMEFVVNEDNEEISMVDVSPYVIANIEFAQKVEENNKIKKMLIKKAYKKFTPLQKQIWDLKVCGHTNVKIAGEVGRESKEVAKEFSKMKNIVVSSLTPDIAESYSYLVD